MATRGLSRPRSVAAIGLHKACALKSMLQAGGVLAASSMSTQEAETIGLVVSTAAECCDASRVKEGTVYCGSLAKWSSTPARLFRSWLLCANTRRRFTADPPRK